MHAQKRKLHSLESIVALCALFAVLAVSVGVAQAGSPSSKRRSSANDFEDPRYGEPGKLTLRSAVALVQDATTGEVVLAKNSETAVPIASITKLMTAMVVLDARLDLEKEITITHQDSDFRKGTQSRLRDGAVLTRDDLLLLALMSSENRAAAALGRSYPGGLDAFVQAMNTKALAIGMKNSKFVDPTGLSSDNVASGQDLARMVRAAHDYALIREYSTRDKAYVRSRGKTLAFHNTNGLLRSPKWEIGLSKTGYISEAGRCLVMRVRVASKDLIVVLLDSWGKYSRVGDAQRIRKWLETSITAG
ncbi:MAG: D-alanyl-D-alanine endopeptidase [Betaproteobacteria bacterium]|nr:D-alanyl-D-alanine endopeptidase [Betaproteobacteria bacterium]